MDLDQKLAIQLYPPGTEFISLFGGVDIVNEKNKHFIDENKDVFVLGKTSYRMIYSQGRWATIL